MKRRYWSALLIAAVTVLLSGCGILSGNELYALPAVSTAYKSLQVALTSLTTSGMEYSAPLTGTNVQPVQDVDLNGDGESEAVAFLKNSDGLQIYFFSQDTTETYKEMTHITCMGNLINSVTYPRLSGGDYREMVFSWQISAGSYMVSAYRIWDGGSEPIMDPLSYSRYVVQDLDGDGLDELILLQMDPSDASKNRAECYRFTDGAMELSSSADLSSDMASIQRLFSGKLLGDQQALYVTGYVLDPATGEKDSTQEQTDVLTIQDGKLVNLTLHEQQNSSVSTRRKRYVEEQDLNGDQILEIPELSNLYERTEDGTVVISETAYMVSWMQYDSSGKGHTLYSTCHNTPDGWYLIVPPEWLGQIALSRSDCIDGTTNERSIWFYEITAKGEDGTSVYTDPATGKRILTNVDTAPFMTISKNSGRDRAARSQAGARTALELENAGSEVNYSVEFYENLWTDWTANDVAENMKLITVNWATTEEE